jgi:hypothetical protein
VGGPLEVERDNAVTFMMLAETLESGQGRVRAALDATGSDLNLDWTDFFAFGHVPQ